VTGLKGQWNDWNFNTGYNHVRSFNAFDSNRVTSYPNLGLDSAGMFDQPRVAFSVGRRQHAGATAQWHAEPAPPLSVQVITKSMRWM